MTIDAAEEAYRVRDGHPVLEIPVWGAPGCGKSSLLVALTEETQWTLAGGDHDPRAADEVLAAWRTAPPSPAAPPPFVLRSGEPVTIGFPIPGDHPMELIATVQHGCHAVMLVYAVDDPDSLDFLEGEDGVGLIDTYAPAIARILVGTRADRGVAIARDRLDAIAAAIHADLVMEVSAHTRAGIDALLRGAAEKILELGTYRPSAMGIRGLRAT